MKTWNVHFENILRKGFMYETETDNTLGEFLRLVERIVNYVANLQSPITSKFDRQYSRGDFLCPNNTSRGDWRSILQMTPKM